ncbi:MAG: winged helix-turn-helix domain-containing protein [Dysgonamonadaceae bacterium]|nr:winged helix-turn-helix domain-containing protein [Dysgonamonadaceae bacterium]
MNYAKLSTPHGDEVGVDNGYENNVNLILNAISEDPKITQKNIAIKTGLSTRTVSREIRELRDTGVIRRIGSDRLGYWEIVK